MLVLMKIVAVYLCITYKALNMLHKVMNVQIRLNILFAV